MGSPANCDSYHLEASFLDGGLRAKTGNYWYAARGAWIRGPKAVLLVALKLGLNVTPAWRRRHGLENISLADLLAELKAAGHSPVPANA